MVYSEDEFLATVKNHNMNVIKDDGLYRHIRFEQPNTNNRYFELVTFPNYLVIVGDMGSWTFSRIQDMFVFFDKDNIDFRYWAEKLVAQTVYGYSNDHYDGTKRFSYEKFKEVVKNYFDEVIEQYLEDEFTKEDYWSAIEDEVLCASNIHEAYANMYHFTFNNFRFHDVHEYDITEINPYFEWCCRAIRWGIRTYKNSEVSHVEDSNRGDAA